MTATAPEVPARCTCPHFENEHQQPSETSPDRPCRADICACTNYTPRALPERLPRPSTVVQRRQPSDPQKIEAQVLGIRDKIAGQGSLISVEDQQAIDAQREQRARHLAREQRRQEFLRELDTVPRRFREQPEGWQPHQQVGEWLHDVENGARASLILLGGVGTGKTTQAFAAWCALVRHGVGRPAWVTTPDLLESLRPGRDARVDLQRLQSADLLLLDDLAAERGSEWTVEVLYRLLDYRYAWELPTIITSNVPPPEITNRLGERIASRLAGMGRTVVLEGPDHRRPQRRA